MGSFPTGDILGVVVAMTSLSICTSIGRLQLLPPGRGYFSIPMVMFSYSVLVLSAEITLCLPLCCLD